MGVLPLGRSVTEKLSPGEVCNLGERRFPVAFLPPYPRLNFSSQRFYSSLVAAAGIEPTNFCDLTPKRGDSNHLATTAHLYVLPRLKKSSLEVNLTFYCILSTKQ